MQNAEGIAIILGVLAFVCMATPILLAATKSRALLIALSVLLTCCAAVLLTVGKGFGDTVLVAAVWIGAMLCGFAAFLDRSMSRNARNISFRLLNNDNDGLEKPDPSK